MQTLLAAVAAAAVTGLLGLFAGAYWEHVRSQEWAKKERWAYKRQTYEETFNLLGEIIWWQAGDQANQQEELDKRSRKLLGLLFRMKVFLNEEAQKAVEDYEKKLGPPAITWNELRDAILVLADKLVIAARTDLDFHRQN